MLGNIKYRTYYNNTYLKNIKFHIFKYYYIFCFNIVIHKGGTDNTINNFVIHHVSLMLIYRL